MGERGAQTSAGKGVPPALGELSQSPPRQHCLLSLGSGATGCHTEATGGVPGAQPERPLPFPQTKRTKGESITGDEKVHDPQRQVCRKGLLTADRLHVGPASQVLRFA